MSIAEIVAINERFTQIENKLAEQAKLIAELALRPAPSAIVAKRKPKTVTKGAK